MCSARPSFAPSVCAIVSVTSAGSRTAASPTQKTPAMNVGTRSAAASRASRVLPEPPGPQSVTMRVPLLSMFDDLVSLYLPPHEGGGSPRQVGVRDRLQRRKALLPELEERDRLGEVLQPVLAELGQVTVDELPRRRGEHDLAAVAARGDPRRPM